MSFCPNIWERWVKEARRAEQDRRHVPAATPPPISPYGTFGPGRPIPADKEG